MRKTIKLEELDCGSCAAKIEHAVSKVDGVTDVKVNFMSQKMILDIADDKFDTVFKEVKKVATKIEPDLVILA